MKPHLSTEEGFTLIEALIALMISSLIIVFLTGSILQIKKINDVFLSDAQSSERSQTLIANDRQMEFHIFLNQLEFYLQGTTDATVGESYISLMEWNEAGKLYERIRYQLPMSNAHNFTRVKKGGNHRMLTEVANLLMKKDGGWLSVQVKFLNAEVYKGRIWVESWVENEIEEEEELALD